MIETPEINNEVQLSEIRDLLHILIREVQELKQQKLPASPEKIEALLAALFVIFNNSEFTSTWILETCIDDDPDAIRLLESIKAVTNGAMPGNKKLSRLLNKVTGKFGGYRLDVANPHGRDGTTFIVSVIK